MFPAFWLTPPLSASSLDKLGELAKSEGVDAAAVDSALDLDAAAGQVVDAPSLTTLPDTGGLFFLDRLDAGQAQLQKKVAGIISKW